MADNQEARDPAADSEVIKNDDGNGVAMDGEFPHNHRLRAEALVAAGKDDDPDGLITPELIASTKARLAAEAEHAKALAEKGDGPVKVTAKTSTAELERIAAEEGVDLSNATTNQQRAEAINAAREQES